LALHFILQYGVVRLPAGLREAMKRTLFDLSKLFFCPTAGQKPKIVKPLQDVKVVALTTATLSCEIDIGQPKSAITWYKDSRELYQGKKYNMTLSINGVAKLEIYQADLSDTSIYRVEANNKLGRVACEAKLLVQGEILNEKVVAFVA
jgi:hypothetical protein